MPFKMSTFFEGLIVPLPLTTYSYVTTLYIVKD